jgi:uncharacterized protein YpmB
MSKKRNAARMGIIMGGTAAFFLAIYLLQYYQNALVNTPSSISSEAAISIVTQSQNVTDFNSTDYETNYVYIAANGDVFHSDLEARLIGEKIGHAEPTSTGQNHYAWQVKNKKYNSTYYVDSESGDIVSKSV